MYSGGFRVQQFHDVVDADVGTLFVWKFEIDQHFFNANPRRHSSRLEHLEA